MLLNILVGSLDSSYKDIKLGCWSVCTTWTITQKIIGLGSQTLMLKYCKTRKNMMIKFHENALKQFPQRLKFRNLASKPPKNPNL